jgi:hypothetical protein
MPRDDDGNELRAGYGELAYAILLWQLRNESGTRAQQIEAERRLTILADSLRAVGYELKAKQ